MRVAGSSVFAKLAPERLVNRQDLDMMSGFVTEDMFSDAPNIDVAYAMRNTTIPVGSGEASITRRTTSSANPSSMRWHMHRARIPISSVVSC